MSMEPSVFLAVETPLELQQPLHFLCVHLTVMRKQSARNFQGRMPSLRNLENKPEKHTHTRCLRVSLTTLKMLRCRNHIRWICDSAVCGLWDLDEGNWGRGGRKGSERRWLSGLQRHLAHPPPKPQMTVIQNSFICSNFLQFSSRFPACK